MNTDPVGFSPDIAFKTTAEMKNTWILVIVLLVSAPGTKGQVILLDSGGWPESAWAVWKPYPEAGGYHVYYIPEGETETRIDSQLIRSYSGYFRADLPGLREGTCRMKIVPVIGGVEHSSAAVYTPSIRIEPYAREGFAFSGTETPGAYNRDGTPKPGAKVLYVTNETANTVTCKVLNDKGVALTYTGISAILTAKGKGYDPSPLIIRFIGQIHASSVEGLKDANYISVTGFNNTNRKIRNVTLEGIGDDATAYGFGFFMKRTALIEIRNLGIMLFGDDAISLDTDNAGIWIHNNDFFYGSPGSDADQVKGDGSIDTKYNSSGITVSFNHFWDSGKVLGCGGATGEETTLYMTFHHNWFDHCDSRTPRLHYTTAHIYNNYYDGVSVYCIGNTTESSALIEANYFRNCNRPMMISGQGTDTYDPSTGTYTKEGTFSGQDGGMNKAFNNLFAGDYKLVYQTDHPVQFDAYRVNGIKDSIPRSVRSVRGNWPYSNFDMNPEIAYPYIADAPGEVADIVTAFAGRLNGGDFRWSFNNQTEDDNHGIIKALKDSILRYRTYSGSYRPVTTAASPGGKRSSDGQLRLYPNPADDFLNFSTEHTIQSITIYSSAGTMVFRADGDSRQIRIGHLNPGLYCVMVDSDAGSAGFMIIKR